MFGLLGLVGVRVRSSEVSADVVEWSGRDGMAQCWVHDGMGFDWIVIDVQQSPSMIYLVCEQGKATRAYPNLLLCELVKSRCLFTLANFLHRRIQAW